MQGTYILLVLGVLGAAMPAAVLGDSSFVGPSFRFAIIGDRTDEVQRLRPDCAITVGDAIQGYTDMSVSPL